MSVIQLKGCDMKIGFFQFAPRFGERDENLRTVARALENASAHLLVLPELFIKKSWKKNI